MDLYAFHKWEKDQEFDSNYPTAFKIEKYLKEIGKKPSCKELERLSNLYEGNFSRFQRLDFIALVRQWKKEYGNEWKTLYNQGYDQGYGGVWSPILRSFPSNPSPFDYGKVIGHNRYILDRR